MLYQLPGFPRGLVNSVFFMNTLMMITDPELKIPDYGVQAVSSEEFG